MKGVVVVEATDGLDPSCLSAQDRARDETFTSAHRRRSFLRGRNALAAVAGMRSTSVTHTESVSAVAAADAAGVGIDREVVRPAASPFFLTEDVPPTELTRLWTVKEALFKADGGRGRLHHYVVADPSAWAGTASRGAVTFEYETTVVEGGVVQTVAVTI